MCNMYETLQSLCADRKITITDMCRESGVPRSSVGNLASGSTQQLSSKNIQKLSLYFGISTDYLLGNEQKEKPAVAEDGGLTARDRRDIAKDLEKIMNDLDSQGTLMFDGNPASPEARASIRSAIAVGLEMAKKMNKEAYTPKKYRKGNVESEE